MKMIFESLSETRVRGTVCLETAILNCVQDIREATEEVGKEEGKKSFGTKSKELIKKGWDALLAVIAKLRSKVKQFIAFIKNKLSKKKPGETVTADGTPAKASTPEKKGPTLAIEYKAAPKYSMHNCITKRHPLDASEAIINKEIIANATDLSSGKKEAKEFFYNYMFGKNVTDVRELDKIEVDLGDIEKALEDYNKGLGEIEREAKQAQHNINNPRMEKQRDFNEEQLVVSNIIAAEIGSIITYILSVLKK